MCRAARRRPSPRARPAGWSWRGRYRRRRGPASCTAPGRASQIRPGIRVYGAAGRKAVSRRCRVEGTSTSTNSVSPVRMWVAAQRRRPGNDAAGAAYRSAAISRRKVVGTAVAAMYTPGSNPRHGPPGRSRCAVQLRKGRRPAPAGARSRQAAGRGPGRVHRGRAGSMGPWRHDADTVRQNLARQIPHKAQIECVSHEISGVPRVRRNHGDVTSSWSGPLQSHIAVVTLGTGEDEAEAGGT